MATIMKLGSGGLAVRRLQTLLNKAGASPALGVDGDFGEKTDRAVREFQADNGLVVDGRVGKQTMTALQRLVAPAKPGKPEPDKSAMNEGVSGAIARPEKGAPPPNMRSLQLLDTARWIDEIIVHCTATPEGKDYTVNDIRAWHKARGWSDVGYHYIIYRDGSIMLGRPVGQIGSHVAGKNTGTIGIAYVGGVTSDGRTAKDTRTAAQVASLLWLTAQLAKKHGVKKVTGHNQYAAKACPSFDVRRDPLGKIAA